MSTPATTAHRDDCGRSNRAPSGRAADSHKGRELREWTILIVGKAGSGKSSLGNLILGDERFKVLHGPKCITTEPEKQSVDVNGLTFVVIDTPDRFSRPDCPRQEQHRLIDWLKETCPEPDALLLTVRINERYTSESYQFFRQMALDWGDQDFYRRLIVAFTFSEEYSNDLNTKSFGPEIEAVLDAAKGRYVVFDSKEKRSPRKKQIECLMKCMSEIAASEPSEGPLRQVADPRHLLSSEVPPAGTILIIGRTGNGKSSLGNVIVGKSVFEVARGLSSKTRTPTAHFAEMYRKRWKVVDTEDTFNMYDNDHDKKQAVSSWKQLTKDEPLAILLAVKCNGRYTPEEHDIYKEIKMLWNNDAQFCRKLIIAFTFGDQQNGDLEQILLPPLYPELQHILTDAQKRCVLFDNTGDEHKKEESRRQLMKHLEDTGAPEVVRVVLLGKAGSGKSSLGNLLANIVDPHQMFAISGAMAAVTRDCDWRCGYRGNVIIEVTDTPGLCNTNLSEDVIYQVLGKGVAVSSPGPHVLLLVFRADSRFTKEEYQAYQTFKTMFSGEKDRFLLVVFVGIDRLLSPGSTLDQQRACLQKEIAKQSTVPNEQNPAQIIADAGGRWFGIDNSPNTSSVQKERQIEELISMMLDLKKQNKDQFYTTVFNNEIDRQVNLLALKYKRHLKPDTALQTVKQKIVKREVNQSFFQEVGATVKKIAGENIKDVCVVM